MCLTTSRRLCRERLEKLSQRTTAEARALYNLNRELRQTVDIIPGVFTTVECERLVKAAEKVTTVPCHRAAHVSSLGAYAMAARSHKPGTGMRSPAYVTGMCAGVF